MKLLSNDNGRLESFSDAVFAFAATLLVVSLEVPETYALLKKQLMGFLSFGVSFAGLVLIWRVHYNFFRRTTYRDNIIVFFNMLLLFTVLYFVYPLKFLTNFSLGGNLLSGKPTISMSAEELSQLFILYGIGFSLIFLCIAMMYRQAAINENENQHVLHFYKRHFFIFVGTGILSIVLSLSGFGLRYGVPGFAYSLLGPLCYLHGRKFEE